MGLRLLLSTRGLTKWERRIVLTVFTLGVLGIVGEVIWLLYMIAFV
ncbi:hypothetical protein [Bradyrhizobium sp. SZCCHNRI2010]|nr:hypothetical protein [Bradyrhizobium sp. SZCCHNRI2010]